MKNSKATLFWLRVGNRHRTLAQYADPRTGFYKLSVDNEETITGEFVGKDGKPHTVRILSDGTTFLDGQKQSKHPVTGAMSDKNTLDMQLAFSFGGD